MSDGDALLAEIIAKPDEDTPRLVYADWLSENGKEQRAELIRVQCELERMPFCDPVCSHESGHREGCYMGERGDVLRKRERELLDGPPGPDGEIRLTRGAEWFANGSADLAKTYLHGLPSQSLTLEMAFGFEYRRGFVEEVTCTAADWVKHADEITAKHPLRRLTLTSVPALEGETSDGVHSVSLLGRDVWLDFPQSTPEVEMLRELLEAEWPTLDIKFEVTEPGQISFHVEGTLDYFSPAIDIIPAGDGFLPRTGWAIEGDQDNFLDSRRDDDRIWVKPEPIRATIWQRVVRSQFLFHLPTQRGVRFGPVEATNAVGVRFECDAILRDWTIDMSQRLEEVLIEALVCDAASLAPIL